MSQVWLRGDFSLIVRTIRNMTAFRGPEFTLVEEITQSPWEGQGPFPAPGQFVERDDMAAVAGRFPLGE